MSWDHTPGRPLRVYDIHRRWQDYSTDDFVGLGLNRFKGWKCSAGVNNIAVTPSGTILAATCGVGGPIGNVFEDFQLPKEWLDCPLDLCSCGADLFIPKARTDAHQDLLRKMKGKVTEISKRGRTSDAAAIERVHAPEKKQIYWSLTFRCNYSCTYCTPMVHNKTELFQPFSKVAKATDRLCEQFGAGGKIHFIISGGEPTLHPHFLDWVRMIHVLGHSISVHSNGSRHPAYYIELNRYADVNLSLHFEHWRPEKFYAVIEAMTKARAETYPDTLRHLEVKIMMKPGQLNQAREVEQRLRSIPEFSRLSQSSIVPIRVGEWLENVDPEYAPEEIQSFGNRP